MKRILFSFLIFSYSYSVFGAQADDSGIAALLPPGVSFAPGLQDVGPQLTLRAPDEDLEVRGVPLQRNPEAAALSEAEDEASEATASPPHELPEVDDEVPLHRTGPIGELGELIPEFFDDRLNSLERFCEMMEGAMEEPELCKEKLDRAMKTTSEEHSLESCIFFAKVATLMLRTTEASEDGPTIHDVLESLAAYSKNLSSAAAKLGGPDHAVTAHLLYALIHQSEILAEFMRAVIAIQDLPEAAREAAIHIAFISAFKDQTGRYKLDLSTIAGYFWVQVMHPRGDDEEEEL